MNWSLRGLLPLAVLAVLSLGVAQAQPPIQPTVDITKVPAAAQPSEHFDADAATEAYLAMIPAAAKARSDAYFEGGYWLILWGFLYSSAISLLLLYLRWSARMRPRSASPGCSPRGPGRSCRRGPDWLRRRRTGCHSPSSVARWRSGWRFCWRRAAG